MLMDPLAIRASDLIVNEAVGRLPCGDHTSPAERDTSYFDAIINLCAFSHYDGGRSENSKIEVLWSYPFKI
jgi:hypothetical protein